MDAKKIIKTYVARTANRFAQGGFITERVYVFADGTAEYDHPAYDVFPCASEADALRHFDGAPTLVSAAQ